MSETITAAPPKESPLRLKQHCAVGLPDSRPRSTPQRIAPAIETSITTVNAPIPRQHPPKNRPCD